MALKYNQLGLLIDDPSYSGDSTATASAYTAALRSKLTNPKQGTVCFDPETKGLLFWNGTTWVPLTEATAGRQVVNVSADYTMPDVSVDVLVVNATAGPITVTLPSAVHAKGREIAVIKSDATANVVTLQHQGTDIIGGGTDTTFTLTMQHSMVKLLSAGSNIWYCV